MAPVLPVLIPGILPPSRENWQLMVNLFTLFPIATGIQWLTDWYPQGKTSINSRFNIPGRLGWMLMEVPGMILVNYCMLSIPRTLGIDSLPWANWTMAGLYTIHYTYRAIISPLMNPSMSPMHPFIFLAAATWQVFNGIGIGGWLAGYGPTTVYDWAGRLYLIEVGMVIWGWSFLGNIFHDDDLREIRRSALRRQKEQAKKDGKAVEGADKLYMIPKNGLFHYILFPHYFCEWVEWAGYWMIGGLDCVPARNFLINEIATMLPRALAGKRWYIEKFGKERVGNRKAVIPGLL